MLGSPPLPFPFFPLFLLFFPPPFLSSRDTNGVRIMGIIDENVHYFTFSLLFFLFSLFFLLSLSFRDTNMDVDRFLPFSFFSFFLCTFPLLSFFFSFFTFRSLRLLIKGYINGRRNPARPSFFFFSFFLNLSPFPFPFSLPF